MRRISLFVLIGALIFTSCRKAVTNPEDILPNVETTDAFVGTDGLFTITGTIISTGTSDLNHLGGCYDSDGNPTMLDNQMAYYSISGDDFTVKYTDFPSSSTVYCRVWATNKNSYAYGEILKVDNLIIPDVTAPCTPTTNTIDMGDGFGEFNMYTVTSPSGGTCYAEANNGRALTFEFSSTPTTKIYTTTTNTPGSDDVRITVAVNSITEYALSGYSVYVNQLGTNEWNIQLCDVGWSPFSSTYNIVADINYPF